MKQGIRKAKVEEANAITELALRSKAHWKYSPEQIERWRKDLTISEDYIRCNEVWVLVKEKVLLGYYGYILEEDYKINLDHFFIEPSAIGKGNGEILMRHFLGQFQSSVHHKVFLYSDPNAESFYKKYGFKVIAQHPSSVPGRFLPIMELELT